MAANPFEINLVKIFSFDTFICSMSGEKLQPFMMNKHGWNAKKFLEYKEIYKGHLAKITLEQ